MGAAVQAAIVAGKNVGAVLVDITPHTLGIKCLEFPDEYTRGPNEFKFAPIVKRNTPLPASRSEVFCTVADNQPTVEVDVYQGDSGDVRRNHRVGKFLIEGLARVPAGNQLVVQLDLTLDGTLRVSAREKGTGLQKHITIQNALARFAVEEREAARARLDRMWGGVDPGPEEQAEADMPQLAPGPAEGQRETVQARALLEKADRVREKVSAEDQGELDRLAGRVREALTGRAWGDLTVASNELSDVLFYLEDA
jgi:molecular chaperone DnaK